MTTNTKSKTKINKILYASDIEKGSRPAFRAAISLCGKYESEITYLHVIEPLSSSAQNLIKNLVDTKDVEGIYQKSLVNLKTKIEQRISRFFEEEVEFHDCLDISKVESRIEDGVSWETIIKVADEIDADVIVMGTRTHSAMGQFFSGSTANKVMLNTKRPLLIIPLGK
ncbi:universal stress protein [Colwellia psychrerythraea]|uniref:Universal stress protein n=1 Tax=Colwellia psychrerythraea TaxID=28229 RepID=A0A1Y5EM93_COLPS|nr:universal stress protein [Colwellia psychrerythraea]